MTTPIAQGPVDVNVSRRDWRKDYQDAYRAANGHDAEVVDDGRGWYRIKTQDGFQTGCRYQRGKILKMTARLVDRFERDGDPMKSHGKEYVDMLDDATPNAKSEGADAALSRTLPLD